MSRTAYTLNRIAVLALGLVLLAGGVATTAWGSGRWQIASGVVDASPVTSFLATSWWPWVAALAGVLAIALALRWIVALLVRSSVRTLPLPGSGSHGRLVVHTDALARTASELLGSTLGVRSVTGRWHRDRDLLVLELTATVDPTTNLDLVADAYRQISADLARTLQRPDVQARVLLRSAPRARKVPRVV